MKNTFIKSIIVILVATLLFGMIVYADESENVYEPITSGTLYDEVISIDPNVEIFNSTPSLSVEVHYEDTEDPDLLGSYAMQLMKDIVNIIEIEGLWDEYSSVMFTCFLGDGIYTISVNNYKDIYSFSTVNLNVLSNQIAGPIFDGFYQMVFGARDLSIVDEKGYYDLAQKYGTPGYEIPEMYQTAYLWALHSFPNLIGISTEDGFLLVRSKTENSALGGLLAGAELDQGIEDFLYFYLTDPDAMRYFGMSILFIDAATGDTLLSSNFLNMNDSWQIINIDYTGSEDFNDSVKTIMALTE